MLCIGATCGCPEDEEYTHSRIRQNQYMLQQNFNDKKSLMPDVSLGTETLAVILEKQGKYDKALAIYENLLARNPEKNSIFAPRIEKLEALLNSK